MSGARYSFTFEQDPQTIVSAMKARPPAGFPKVRGQAWAFAMKVLQCVMLGLGAVGFAVVLEWVISGQLRFGLWSFALGILLFYVAIFGTLFVTIPVMVRRALKMRINQSPVTMTLDDTGLHSKMQHFHSTVEWTALEGVTRTKSSFIFWLGNNRPSLPFHALQDAAQIEEVDKAITSWIETSR